jgi:hypothetical protein
MANEIFGYLVLAGHAVSYDEDDTDEFEDDMDDEPEMPFPIPTLSQWSMIVLALLLIVTGLWVQRRRRKVGA